MHVFLSGVCAWYECLWGVRSDMSQLCSCSPLAQIFSCWRWGDFSSDETNIVPFLIALGLLQDVSRKLRQAKWGQRIQGATYPNNALWLPSSHKPFAVALWPCPLQVTSMAMMYPCSPGSLTLTQPSLKSVGCTCPVDVSVASKSYVRVDGAEEKNNFDCTEFSIIEL